MGPIVSQNKIQSEKVSVTTSCPNMSKNVYKRRIFKKLVLRQHSAAQVKSISTHDGKYPGNLQNLI